MPEQGLPMVLLGRCVPTGISGNCNQTVSICYARNTNSYAERGFSRPNVSFTISVPQNL